MIAHGARLEFFLNCFVTHMRLFVSYEAHPVSREMRLAFHKKCPLHSMCVWRFLASSVLFSCKAHFPYCFLNHVFLARRALFLACCAFHFARSKFISSSAFGFSQDVKFFTQGCLAPHETCHVSLEKHSVSLKTLTPSHEKRFTSICARYKLGGNLEI